MIYACIIVDFPCFDYGMSYTQNGKSYRYQNTGVMATKIKLKGNIGWVVEPKIFFNFLVLKFIVILLYTRRDKDEFILLSF